MTGLEPAEAKTNPTSFIWRERKQWSDWKSLWTFRQCLERWKVCAHTHKHTCTHTGWFVFRKQSTSSGKGKNKAPAPQQWVHCVTKKRHYIQCQCLRMKMSCLQCETAVQRDGLHGIGTAATALQKRKRYRNLLLRLSPPSLKGFHSSPITSSNDSNLSCCTCGSSKNGRHMWEKPDAITETQGEGFLRHTIFTRSKCFPSLLTFN